MIRSISNDAVHSLLSHEHNVVYKVPKYQREYSWGRDQWDALIDDLLERLDGDGHFLGTIICVNNTVDSVQENVLEVIDGQQRLTTISLLLAAIYNALEEHRAELEDDDLVDFMNLKRMLVLKDPARPRLRPQIQRDNDKDYQHVLAIAGLGVLDPNPSYAGVRRVKKAYVHFQSRIRNEAMSQEVSSRDVALDLLRRTKRSNIVKLEMLSHADAFTLFESLNNRGMPLTPIDLIKNSLLGKADQPEGYGLDSAYDAWSKWLRILGDDYSTQERFFRYFYNAMRDDFDTTVAGAREATRSNLIRIYETLIENDVQTTIALLSKGVDAFEVLMGAESGNKGIDKALRRLRRAQGLPGHVLALYLLLKKDEISLADTELIEILDLLTSFFVRRNMTNIPATNASVRLGMEIIQKLRDADPIDRKRIILTELKSVSASDDQFRTTLTGPVYELNSDVVRFVLTDIAEDGMTAETTQDLWARVETAGKSAFRWSIEHILPQGENLPSGWVTMLGGEEKAIAAREQFTHHLGNLTITGYNSSLSNRSFVEKRDHVDSRGNAIGYRNGLNLNSDVSIHDTWGVQQIVTRSEKYADLVMEKFPLEL